ncbi:TIGR04086 family membrane protein [Wansuia hejianensis]|uniref:TIGR04086 family membrane protein n=1 Tax=Wansuia hejianensis TaxID=2763667 RepID=A0A926IN78_9FIRM|nr:TIGR04086 family membrane protein [Wansuia hejianensis]MBC8590413.1 TIGR04086 family membrane protein [Wansuia hejianensis]
MKNKLNFNYLLKALILGFILTFIMIFITALLLRFTDLREIKIPLMNNITMVICIVFPSIYLATRVKEKGWIHGAILGFIYYSIIVILNIILARTKIFAPVNLIKLMIATLIGAIGGMIGINLI